MGAFEGGLKVAIVWGCYTMEKRAERQNGKKGNTWKIRPDREWGKKWPKNTVGCCPLVFSLIIMPYEPLFYWGWGWSPIC